MADNLVIHIDNILMDEENPRHDIINGQGEILNWHVEHLGSKLITLMRSIAQNGLSEIERVLVMPLPKSKGKFVVKEGNRRLAAIKLLFNPALCEDPVFRRRIESVSISDNLLFEVDCVVSKDRARVLWMMGLRHLGLQGGAGTSTWGAAEKGRHDLNETGTARYWRSLEFIEYAQANKLITDQQAARLNEKITNLDRLVPSEQFKKALGVSYSKDRQIIKTLPKHIFDRVLANILEEFSQPDFKVKGVYADEDKTSFIERALDKAAQQLKIDKASVPLPDSKIRLEEGGGASVNPYTGSPKPLGEDPVPEKTGDDKIIDGLFPKLRRQPDPSQRDKLFIGKLSIPSHESKCNKLYNQIDSLKLADHGLVIACAARALVEISSRIYIDKFDVEAEGKKNSFGQISFGDMIKACATDLHDKKLLSKELKHVIVSGEAANPNSFASPQSLHSFLHGRYQNSMDSLKAAWEKCYEEYLRVLWVAIKNHQV